MAKVSATILTLNEAENIEACLASLEGVADEIVVVDSFSTDETLEICRRHNCKISQREFMGYGAQRQYATSLTTHSYVLSIDADEVLSPALRQSILKLKERGFDHRVYSVARLNFYCGRPIRHCGWYPDFQIRLFDKRYANWNLRDVAERVIFRDTVRPERLDGDILHYRCRTPQEYEQTEQTHAEIRSRVIAAKGDMPGLLSPVMAGAKAYLNCYIRQGGICDGAAGHAISRQRWRSESSARKMARRIMKEKK